MHPDTGPTVCRHVVSPRSSCHCELIALGLALVMGTPQVLANSLVSLHLVRGWGTWSVQRRLHCADRRQVRCFLYLRVLDKVAAHDAVALARGHPRAVGNDLMDAVACACCGASEEDETHVVPKCPATGNVDWLIAPQEM